MSDTAQALAGRRIAVPETRELDVFATLLERRGATVLRCPLVAIIDVPDPAPVLGWIADVVDGGCDDLILMTGEGLRRLLTCIDTHAAAQRDGFLRQLAAMRLFVRGPKPAKVLRDLGLAPTLQADPATTDGLIAALQDHALRDRRIGLQLAGQAANPPLTGFLESRGAEVRAVTPYAYADAAADGHVEALIDAIAAATVDAVAFTSAAQVDRLYAVAKRLDREAAVTTALDTRVCCAAVGPVAAAALSRRGVTRILQPEGRYFLKPLTQALVESLRR